MFMYAAPVNEMQFLVNEVLLKNSDIAEIVPTLLEAASRLARDELAPINKSGDEQGVSINQEGVVSTANGFKEAYQEYVNGGWGSLQFDPKYGGQDLPFVLAVSTQEMWHAANMSWGLCPLLTQGAVEAINYGATEQIKSIYLPKLISGTWTGTMNLTESDAGSDLGALKTKAWRENDHYLIKGQKIFITWGDHDMAENIAHLVLARLSDAPAGVKGISLFLVPKMLTDTTGELSQKNDCKAVSLEKKIGIHGCPTCVMSYGEKSGAVGYLIGQENKGLECMFAMMNNARLTVGLQGVSIADRACQQALAYCNDRIQGVAPGFKEPGPIIRHPDVKRMLSLMQVLTDGARSLTYYACAEVDQSKAISTTKKAEMHKRRVGLLTPLVKGWCTEIGQEVVNLNIQCHGGAGYIEETGAGQLFRDARILPIYEGTNGIQAMDLVFRKVVYDDGCAIKELIQEMTLLDNGTLTAFLTKTQAESYKQAVEALEATANLILNNKSNKKLLGGIAFDFLMMTSVITAAWRLIESATTAKIDGIDDKYSQEFISDRLSNAATFISTVLPRYQTHHSIILCLLDKPAG